MAAAHFHGIKVALAGPWDTVGQFFGFAAHTSETTLDCQLLGGSTMLRLPEPILPALEATARVTRAAFPKGNVYVQMKDG